MAAKLTGRMSSEKRFALIVTTDVDAKTSGFFWCGGPSWDARDYRCVLLAEPSSGHRYLGGAIELRADTPEGLAEAMAEHAMVPLSAEEIRVSCESAASTPRNRRRVRARPPKESP